MSTCIHPAGDRGAGPMNSCVVNGLTGEAEDRQISGYMHGPNKETEGLV
jgi:hypothetical protein